MNDQKKKFIPFQPNQQTQISISQPEVKNTEKMNIFGKPKPKTITHFDSYTRLDVPFNCQEEQKQSPLVFKMSPAQSLTQPVFNEPAPIQPRYKQEAQFADQDELERDREKFLTQTYVKDKTLIEQATNTKIVYKPQIKQQIDVIKIKTQNPRTKQSFNEDTHEQFVLERSQKKIIGENAVSSPDDELAEQKMLLYQEKLALLIQEVENLGIERKITEQKISDTILMLQK